MLTHSSCGGKIVLDISNTYKLVTNIVRISHNKIEHGGVEFTQSGKKQTMSFICRTCQDSFSSKEDFEKVICPCSVCRNLRSASDIFVAEGGFFLCTACVALIKEDKPVNAKRREPDFLGYIKNMELGELNVTLLTLLMKHK